MTITVAVFRGQQPSFMNPAVYLDGQIQFFIDLGYSMLTSRWGNSIDYGVSLFTAHFLALAKQAEQGGPKSVPGVAIGVVSGGTVDKVSYTRDITSIMEDSAGHWGMTSFGLIYLRLARMMGAGPIQIGAGGDPGYLGAWPGPFPGVW